MFLIEKPVAFYKCLYFLNGKKNIKKCKFDLKFSKKVHYNKNQFENRNSIKPITYAIIQSTHQAVNQSDTQNTERIIKAWFYYFNNKRTIERETNISQLAWKLVLNRIVPYKQYQWWTL